jgi:hypothetical protein
VALGNVVYHLTNVPTSGAIRSRELLYSEPIDGLAEASRGGFDLLDESLTLGSCERRRRDEFPNGIGQIRHNTSLLKAPSDITGAISFRESEPSDERREFFVLTKRRAHFFPERSEMGLERRSGKAESFFSRGLKLALHDLQDVELFLASRACDGVAEQDPFRRVDQGMGGEDRRERTGWSVRRHEEPAGR